MKTQSLALVITAAAALFVVGCSQKESPAPAGVSSAPAAAGGGPKFGTSDSGGGTGVEGKIFEAYIVDPMTLPEFKEHLAPRFANLTTKRDEQKLDMIMKLKTWYIAPVELDKVAKDLLGVSFIKNSTTQIARQKLFEVWIDGRIYNHKDRTTYDKAVTLAHEWVMAMYMMKFMTMADMYKAAPDMIQGCATDTEQFDKLAPPVPVRALDESDNENIRFVTDWFLRNSLKPLDVTDFLRVLKARNFDKRFFDPSSDYPDRKTEVLKVSRGEMLTALKGSTLTNTMPNRCTGNESGKTVDCKLEFEEAKGGMHVRITLPGHAPIEFDTFVYDEVDLSLSGDPGTTDLYSMNFFNGLEKPHVGDRGHTLSLLFNTTKTKGQIELRSATLRTGVIVSIDKKRDPVCFVRAPKVESLADDGLIIRREGFEPLMLEKYYAGSPPLAVCYPDKVD